MENFKISIPKPCHEDWNKMTENEMGRFCNQCAKSVIDFSTMGAAEIQEYFKLHKSQKICGRFKTEQLDTIIIQIPRETLFVQTQFRKIFLLALLISMGTTLFSCSDSNGNQRKINSVSIIDRLTGSGATKGEVVAPEDIDTTETVRIDSSSTFSKKTADHKSTTTKNQSVINTTETHPLMGDVEIEPTTDSISK